MKIFIKLFFLFAVLAYLIFAIVKFSVHEDNEQCQQVNIVIADSAQATLITAADVEQMLHKYSLHPRGRLIKDVSLIDIENRLNADPFIQNASCMFTPGASVRIHIVQRLPLLRIMGSNGDDFYIDEKGFRMAARGYEADLAVVTGSVDEQFAKQHLVEFGILLRDDPFWNSQIEQINVRPDHNLDLVMRVGNPIVHFGKPENVARKLKNLRAFYEKVLPKVGWHRYKAISIAFENQVIGIKDSKKTK